MKQPSSTRRKQTAKAVILFFLGISVLCSCQRGIDITKIEARPEGAAKDQACCTIIKESGPVTLLP